MARLDKLEVPETLFQFLERRAREHGISVADQVIEDLTHVQQEESDEQRLMEEIRIEREQMATRGVFITDKMLREAKNWGRE